jgi:pimeloyl-ACP methyl ester carboxylesterase
MTGSPDTDSAPPEAARRNRSRLRSLAAAAAAAALGLAVLSAGAAASGGGVVSDACPPASAGATCGHVDVPLDRSQPGGAAVPIAFELYRHTEPGPAQSAVVVNTGFGFAGSTLASGATVLPLFAPLRARHDLVLVDLRGRGRSGVVDCPALQHATVSLREGAQACAEQLGAATQRYGLGDIAKDVEAVRAALGYDKIDYYGLSYGGGDIAAYATRFGEHLRSIVIDAPWGPPQHERNLVARDVNKVQAVLRRVELVCERSENCSSAQPDPAGRMRQLVRRLQRQPLTGTARDFDGKPREVHLDPAFLLVNVMEDRAPYIISGELPAAADALRHGDRAPILRLAAENDFPSPSDFGDATGFSAGAWSATFCAENRYPWSPDAPLSARVQQWDAAVRAAADEPFAPFRAEEVLRSSFDEHDICLPWPAPTTSTPTVEAGARYPRVPAIVLAGDLDSVATLQYSKEMADLFPGSTFVPVAGAGHRTLYDSPCAAALAVALIDTLKVGDTSCAATSPKAYPGVGRFPLTAADSAPAQAHARHGGGAGSRDLRVARVAVDTALDALKRSHYSAGDGAGLRGGTFHTEVATGGWTTTLDGARYARDVAVSGTVRWAPDGSAEGRVEADLTVDGPGAHDGTLRVTGTWLAHGPATPLRVAGTLRDHRVDATVPSA